MQSDDDVVIEVSDDGSDLSISLLEDDNLNVKLQDLEISQGGKGVKLTPGQRERARPGTSRTRTVSSSTGSHKTGGKPDHTALYAMRLAKQAEKEEQKDTQNFNEA